MNANETIKRLMKLHGVTYAEMGRRLGKSEKTVAGMMRPGRNLTERTIHRLATQLGYEPGTEFYLVAKPRKVWALKHAARWALLAHEVRDKYQINDAPMRDVYGAKQWVSAMIEREADERLAKELE